jgi:sugar lactone lactonase YvrE
MLLLKTVLVYIPLLSTFIICQRYNVTTLTGGANRKAGYIDSEGKYSNYYGIVDLGIDQNGALCIAEGNKFKRIVNRKPQVYNSIPQYSIVSFVFGANEDMYYISEYPPTIEKITKSGVVSAVAGSTEGFENGAASTAKFNDPRGLALDAAGNIYIADTGNFMIRKISTNRIVSTYAGTGIEGDGNGVNVPLKKPVSLVIDRNNNVIFTDGDKVKKVTTSGNVSTVADFSSQLSSLTDIAIDGSGNLYVSDNFDKIRKIDVFGSVTLIAGGGSDNPEGPGNTVGLNFPSSLAVDSLGNVFFVDTLYAKIIKVINSTGYVSIYSGFDSSIPQGNVNGNSSVALLNYPAGLTIGDNGTIYVLQNSGIKKIDKNGILAPFAGDSTFTGSNSMVIGADNSLYFADTLRSVIKKVTPDGMVSTFAGSTTSGNVDGGAAQARFSFPFGVAFDSKGNLFVADYFNMKIRKITPDGIVSTFAGSGLWQSSDGQGVSASLLGPQAIDIDKDDNIYVAESSNLIRKITPSGYVSTFAGSKYSTGFKDGALSSATFDDITSLTIDKKSGIIYVGQKTCIRRISTDGVTTIVGTDEPGVRDGLGTYAEFNEISSVYAKDSFIYVSDKYNGKIRKIEIVAGVDDQTTAPSFVVIGSVVGVCVAVALVAIVIVIVKRRKANKADAYNMQVSSGNALAKT